MNNSNDEINVVLCLDHMIKNIPIRNILGLIAERAMGNGIHYVNNIYEYSCCSKLLEKNEKVNTFLEHSKNVLQNSKYNLYLFNQNLYIKKELEEKYPLIEIDNFSDKHVHIGDIYIKCIRFSEEIDNYKILLNTFKYVKNNIKSDITEKIETVADLMNLIKL